MYVGSLLQKIKLFETSKYYQKEIKGLTRTGGFC